MSKMVIATSASAEPPIPISGAYTPLKLTIFGLVAWCLLLFIGPLQIDTSNFDFEALLFLAISMGAMMGGMWVGNAFGARPSRVNYINPADMPKRLFLIITAVALLGLVLRITDRFGLRDMEITADLWQNRLSLEGDTTIFGLIGAALFPFGLALIPILWSMPRGKADRHQDNHRLSDAGLSRARSRSPGEPLERAPGLIRLVHLFALLRAQ